MTNIEKIFIKNELLIKKIKEQDPSVFILNHQQDFLKIYDYNWEKIYDYLRSRQKNEENIFLCLL